MPGVEVSTETPTIVVDVEETNAEAATTLGKIAISDDAGGILVLLSGETVVELAATDNRTVT